MNIELSYYYQYVAITARLIAAFSHLRQMTAAIAA